MDTILNKRLKSEDSRPPKNIELAPILKVKLGSAKDPLFLKALCDTGASRTMASEKVASFGPITINKNIKIFTTAMGSFKNEMTTKLNFQLPEFSNSMEITWKCDVVKGLENTPYDLIPGRDLLREL